MPPRSISAVGFLVVNFIDAAIGKSVHPAFILTPMGISMVI